jgi:hypothetical protein
MKQKALALVIAICLLFLAVPGLVGFIGIVRGIPPVRPRPLSYYDEIIEKGLKEFEGWKTTENLELAADRLEAMYNSLPEVRRAIHKGNSMTINFMDGFCIVLLDLYCFWSEDSEFTERIGDAFTGINLNIPGKKTAVVLNCIGVWPITGAPVVRKLQEMGYTVKGFNHEEITLEVIEKELAAGTVWTYGHGGVRTTPEGSEVVILQTGEEWTDNTPSKYPIEYRNGWIICGKIDNTYIIAYTPMIISNYYQSGAFPDSLIYVASCDGTKNPSMGNAFINKGAGAYIGWNNPVLVQNCVLERDKALRMFASGDTVEKVVKASLPSLSPFPYILAKLTYMGDGDLTLV